MSRSVVGGAGRNVWRGLAACLSFARNGSFMGMASSVALDPTKATTVPAYGLCAFPARAGTSAAASGGAARADPPRQFPLAIISRQFGLESTPPALKVLLFCYNRRCKCKKPGTNGPTKVFSRR